MEIGGLAHGLRLGVRRLGSSDPDECPRGERRDIHPGAAARRVGAIRRPGAPRLPRRRPRYADRRRARLLRLHHAAEPGRPARASGGGPGSRLPRRRRHAERHPGCRVPHRASGLRPQPQRATRRPDRRRGEPGQQRRACPRAGEGGGRGDADRGRRRQRRLHDSDSGGGPLPRRCRGRTLRWRARGPVPLAAARGGRTTPPVRAAAFEDRRAGAGDDGRVRGGGSPAGGRRPAVDRRPGRRHRRHHRVQAARAHRFELPAPGATARRAHRAGTPARRPDPPRPAASGPARRDGSRRPRARLRASGRGTTSSAVSRFVP